VQNSTDNPLRNMTITYVITLSVIAGFSILIHFMLDRIIEEQTDIANIVNISGQQRMLSQRTSLFTVEYLSSGKVEFKQDAINSLKAMKENHTFLLRHHFSAMQNNQESPLSESMYQLYFGKPHQVDLKLRGFSELIMDALNNDLPKGNEERKYLETIFWGLAHNTILDSLNTVVDQYETESRDKVNELRQAQQLVFFVILFTLLTEALFVFRPMVEKIRRLGKQADRDYLTGLLNRRSFELLAEKTFSMAVRNKQVFSLITFDIDRFKIINDTYGHDVGDKAIQHISELIISGSRDSDIVSRFGGEEFVVMLPTTNRENANVVAEKIRKKIQNSPFTLNGLVIEMTVSGGVSQYLRTEKGWFASLKRSDKALYKAKKSGRNRTCLV
jgi:diguanylate cyclase (GGDEF)-like protein